MLPDEPTDEEKQEQLPQDGQTPFQPADPPRDPSMPADDSGQLQASQLDDTHQVTDTNIDPQEQYDEGVSGAGEASEPNAGNAVTDFTPPTDDAADPNDPAAGDGEPSGGEAA